MGLCGLLVNGSSQRIGNNWYTPVVWYLHMLDVSWTHFVWCTSRTPGFQADTGSQPRPHAGRRPALNRQTELRRQRPDRPRGSRPSPKQWSRTFGHFLLSVSLKPSHLHSAFHQNNYPLKHMNHLKVWCALFSMWVLLVLACISVYFGDEDGPLCLIFSALVLFLAWFISD